MKKFLIIFIILISLLFIMQLSKMPENTQKLPVFWTMQLGSFEGYINGVISKWENGGIKWIDIPYSEAEKRTLAAVLSSNQPDLVNLTPDFSMLLAQKNALWEIPADVMQNYNLTEALKFNGKYYGIPFYATSAVTLFNKSLMPSLKKMPKTYDELLRIKPPEGAYITMINFGENDTLLKILNKYGINSVQTINSEKSAELFKLFKDAYDNKYIPPSSAVQSHREALEQYMAGKLVFLVTGANFLNMIEENAPDVYKNTAVLPQLTGSTGGYDFSLMNFIIPAKAENKEKALNFALFLTNPENQTAFSKLTSVLPVNKQALKDDFFKKSETGTLKEQARIISAKQLEKMQMPLKNTRNKKDLNLLSIQAVQEILINNKDIQETLDNFKNEWIKLEEPAY